MPPKVFILGATGFIGGDAVYTISEAHPDWELTCLVRNSDKGAKVAAKFPKIKLVYGDLDSAEVIAEEVKKADIVYTFADCDHVASAETISKSIRAKSTPTWLIHTSGTSILTWETLDHKAYGKALPKVYNDLEGIDELTSLPDHAPHRNVDKIILAISKARPDVHTAIVCPPTIYGLGRGSDKIDSSQANLIAREVIKQGEGFNVRGSENIWFQIHVHNLSNLFLRLGETAVNNADDDGKPATWNEQGYYLCESGSFVWNDIIVAATKHAHKLGLIESANVRTYDDPEEVRKFSPHFLSAVGSTSVGHAIRARKLLGWEPDPKLPSLVDTVPDVVEREAKGLGLLKGHSQKIADEASKSF